MKVVVNLSEKMLHVPLVSLQVLIKPKPVFQTAVVSEQTRQLVTETLQQVTRSADIGQGQTSGQDGSTKDESGSSAGEASHSSVQGKLPLLYLTAQSREMKRSKKYVNKKFNVKITLN